MEMRINAYKFAKLTHVVIEAQMDLAISRDSHGDNVVAIHDLLDVITESQELPVPGGWSDPASSDVDLVVAVASRSRVVKSHILVVFKRDESVILVADAVETFWSANVGSNVPMVCRNDLNHDGVMDR